MSICKPFEPTNDKKKFVFLFGFLGVISLSLDIWAYQLPSLNQFLPPWAEVTLEFDKPEYILGETVSGHFCVKNAGYEPFLIRVGGETHPHRDHSFKVTGTEINGPRLSDPNVIERYKPNRPIRERPWVNDLEINPGSRWCRTLPLHRYVHIDRAGSFQIEAVTGFGWKMKDWQSVPTATARIQFTLPSPEHANRLVQEAFAEPLSENSMRLIPQGEKYRDPYVDYGAFSHPIYLHLLKEKAALGDTRAVEGISAIKTREATRVLLEFLIAPNPAVVYSAWSAVSRRLPDPHIFKTLASGHLKPENNLAHFLDRKAEIDATWRPEFIPMIRSSVPSFLGSTDEILKGYGAWIMRQFPHPSDVPLLAKALTQAIEDYDNISSRARQRVPNFLAAAESLAPYQDVIPQNPHTDGEIALYILGVKWAYRNTGIARKEMEEKIGKWRGHPSEVIRQIIDRE
ncbi:MAG: hypothetical protein R3B74_18075 [Nitrospirales bacterium]|nr:hypothetical protein [Nitrospirales bacterium]